MIPSGLAMKVCFHLTLNVCELRDITVTSGVHPEESHPLGTQGNGSEGEARVHTVWLSWSCLSGFACNKKVPIL